jgi:hypothetical protein
VVRISGQVYRGTYPVPVERIIGSVNKGQDFDPEFNPRHSYSRSRWERLFVILIEHGSLPPVDLYKVGCFYFVVDGHHRVSVARRLGMSHIEARVTEHVTQDLTQISDPAAVYQWIRHAGSRQGATLCEGGCDAQNKPAGRLLDFRLPLALRRRSDAEPECEAC